VGPDQSITGAPGGASSGCHTHPYAATTRYALSDVPDEPEPTLEDARTAVAIAEAIGVAIRAWLDQAANSRDTDADPADGEDWDKPEVRGGA